MGVIIIIIIVIIIKIKMMMLMVVVAGYESRRSLIELRTQRELSVSKPLLRVSHTVSVCLSVCLSVCSVDYSENFTFWSSVDLGTRNCWIDVGFDLSSILLGKNEQINTIGL